MKNLHIRHMKDIIWLLPLCLVFLSCGGEDDPVFTAEEMQLITSAAGSTARNLAYSPEDENWSPAPNGETLAMLEEISSRNVELWPVFFRTAADTAAKLEQILVMEQQEQQQSELL